MRKIITYVAWDGEKFDTEEECRRYEKSDIDAMRELIACYEFDTGITQLSVMIYEDDIEKTIEEFDDAYGKCTYVNIKKIPSKKSLDFMDDVFGMSLLPKEVGRYWYDFNMSKWEKVAD